MLLAWPAKLDAVRQSPSASRRRACTSRVSHWARDGLLPPDAAGNPPAAAGGRPPFIGAAAPPKATPLPGNRRRLGSLPPGIGPPACMTPPAGIAPPKGATPPAGSTPPC